MNKAIIALVLVLALVASLAAAQVALPSANVKALEAKLVEKPTIAVSSVATTLAVPTAVALSSSQQCMCSDDVMLKIKEIRRMLDELEQSCYSQPYVPPVQAGESGGQVPQAECPEKEQGCFGNCVAEQKNKYDCKKQCEGYDSTGECVSKCEAGLVQKCKNSCYPLPVAEPGCVEKASVQCAQQCDAKGVNTPEYKECTVECTNGLLKQCQTVCPSTVVQQPACVDTCMARNYDKAGCLGTCSADDMASEGPCYTACKEKAAVVYGMCQKECLGQASSSAPTPSVEATDACVGSCEQKYAECKNSCAASSNMAADECVKQTCIPLLEQCSSSCKKQYGEKETFVQKVVSVFRPSSFKNAKWICHDGTESVEGGETSCKPSEVWSGYAKEACEGKCNELTKKCGVNTFLAYNEC